MAEPQVVTANLLNIYHVLEIDMGDLHWWPADSAEEVVIGAILVQNVAWRNVVTAIDHLRSQHLLSLAALHVADAESIEPLIRSTLYYRMKARKLKAFAAHVADEHSGSLAGMLAQPLAILRSELLSIYGIGAETADDIVLYAAGHPSFVVDTYTRRIFARLGYVQRTIPYHPLRAWFMAHLPADAHMFNHFHAWLDAVGNRFCSEKKPKCASCPLASLCMYPQEVR